MASTGNNCAARKLHRRINFYPPYLGAAVRVTRSEPLPLFVAKN
ncbi:MAG TPA: hypothetical protein VJW55_12450 [Candidatus Angelobacter sp.]|jgi:hypothetical protein|nr:hypothetical protein [Candidatus Angelobacter sp.]